MRIAVFQHAWVLNRHTTLLANALSEKGNEVHLFTNLAEDDYGYVKDSPSLHVHPFVPDASEYEHLLAERWKNFAYAPGHAGMTEKEAGLLVKLDVFYDLAARYAYDLCQNFDFTIGIEKGGLLWAHALWKLSAAPYVYYSLELYPPDFLRQRTPLLFAMCQTEPLAHQNALATLVQCPERWRVLRDINRLEQENVLFLPVSVPAPPAGGACDFTPFPPDKKVCILFGYGRLNENEAARLESVMPEDYVFYAHSPKPIPGFCPVPESASGKVVVSEDLLSEDALHALLCAAHVGFAWYHAQNDNNRLIAFSSEKVARYLKAGLPLLVNAQSNFEALFDEFPCGVTLQSIEDMPHALKTIDAHYDAFSKAAQQAFARHYDFTVNFEAVYKKLMALI